jgi:hypothetical protein
VLGCIKKSYKDGIKVKTDNRVGGYKALQGVTILGET